VGLDSVVTGQQLYSAQPDVFGDASKLPFAQDSFDCVLLLDVVEHLQFPREALLEAARVLRPGGVLIVSMPFLYPVHDAPYDFQRYTGYGLAREIDSAGLVLDRIESSLGSAETAGLLGSLALGGMAQEALRRRSPALILLPILALALLTINLLAWLAGRILPSWPALTAGYSLCAHKP
jgi:SAM-dependent methyltransferase